MELLLAILLYLQMIVSPGTYMESHIDALEIIHQVEINTIKADPAQMQIVNSTFLPQVEHVIIINDQVKD